MITQCVIGINRKKGFAECWWLTPNKIIELMNGFNHWYDRWEIVPDHRWYNATIYDYVRDMTINVNGKPMRILRVNILANDPYVERRFFGKKKGL